MIGGGGQNVVDAAGGEPAPPPQNATLVEPCCDRLHAHGAALGAGGHGENHPHDTRFRFVDNQHFLVLVAATLGNLDTVTIRRA
ncbi:hypothetical protein [Sphingopyxis terrae]|uniref:hypothetical protein n=1 Tax=Sphingopyxis terrae TaxID=33052 RepID=UPI00363AE6D4